MSEKKAQVIGIASLRNVPMEVAPRQVDGLQESPVILPCRGGQGQSAARSMSGDGRRGLRRSASGCIQRFKSRAKAKQITAETMVTTAIMPQTWP